MFFCSDTKGLRAFFSQKLSFIFIDRVSPFLLWGWIRTRCHPPITAGLWKESGFFHTHFSQFRFFFHNRQKLNQQKLRGRFVCIDRYMQSDLFFYFRRKRRWTWSQPTTEQEMLPDNRITKPNGSFCVYGFPYIENGPFFIFRTFMHQRPPKGGQPFVAPAYLVMSAYLLI